MDTEKVFRDMLVDIAKKQGYEDYSLKITPISSDGANFTTALYTAVISAPNKADLQLFGKVGNVNEKMREDIFSSNVYDIERIAYQELVEIYRIIEDKHSIPADDKLALPKVYGFNWNYLQETVVLENLAAQGFSLQDRLKTVDWQYASKAVELLARFHALSMVYAESNPDSFKRHYEKFSTLVVNVTKLFQMAIEMALPLSLSVVREENRDRVKAFFDNNKDKLDFALAFEPVRKPVLVHADFKQSNLMHRYNEDGSIDMYLLDLQTIRPSSVVVDLLQFIFTSTDAAFRKEHYSQLVDYYYDTLSRLLRAYGLNPDKVYSRDDFDFELQERLYFGLLISMFTLPMVTMETADVMDQSKVTSLEDFEPKTGETFPDRMNGVVDDFVRWGVI